MTIKQKNILASALRLFAAEGFHATSTSKIAREAGVSEGLIFRHFTNKDGLLEAILKQGEEELTALLEPLYQMDNPKKILETILEMPFRVPADQHNYWRLIYTLKWQQRAYNDISVDPLMDAAVKAFEALGYADPQAEAQVLEIILDGAATVILLKDEPTNWTKTLEVLKAKYHLHK